MVGFAQDARALKRNIFGRTEHDEDEQENDAANDRGDASREE